MVRVGVRCGFREGEGEGECAGLGVGRATGAAAGEAVPCADGVAGAGVDVDAVPRPAQNTIATTSSISHGCRRPHPTIVRSEHLAPGADWRTAELVPRTDPTHPWPSR